MPTSKIEITSAARQVLLVPDFTGADAVEPCKDKADRIFGKQAQNAVDDAADIRSTAVPPNSSAMTSR